MYTRSLTKFILTGFAVLLYTATLSAQQAPAPDDGIEVLTTGPIHEAYAEPVSSQPQPSPIIPKQPPAPIEEVPSEQKPAGDNVQWIPGYWAWDDGRSDFVWVSGFWRVPPPDRQWVPGYWSQAQGGSQWTPGFWADATQTQGAQAQVTYLPPPPASIDNGPAVPAPQAGSVYVPGNWIYAQSRYAWRPGFWNMPRAGWVWIPAHYVWTPSGYVFVDGYWDYELNERGLLFAPVYLARGLWARPGWSYQPRYMVYPDFLLSSLFVRPGAYSYYFGDYFDPRFARLGYRSWLDYRQVGAVPDPLFSYYRWQNRGNANWLPGMRQLYTGRFNGTVARPPHTFAEQNTLVQNVRNRTVNVTNINHVMGVAPLANVDTRRTATKLVAVTAAQRQQVVQNTRQVHDARQKRTQSELQLRPQAPVKTNDPARVGTLHVSSRPSGVKASKTKAPPPRPDARPAPKTPKTKPGAPAHEKKSAQEKKQASRPVTPGANHAGLARSAPHPAATAQMVRQAQKPASAVAKHAAARPAAAPRQAHALAHATAQANKAPPQARKPAATTARHAAARPAAAPRQAHAPARAPAHATAQAHKAPPQARRPPAAPARHAAARPTPAPRPANHASHRHS